MACNHITQHAPFLSRQPGHQFPTWRGHRLRHRPDHSLLPCASGYNRICLLGSGARTNGSEIGAKELDLEEEALGVVYRLAWIGYELRWHMVHN